MRLPCGSSALAQEPSRNMRVVDLDARCRFGVVGVAKPASELIRLSPAKVPPPQPLPRTGL